MVVHWETISHFSFIKLELLNEINKFMLVEICIYTHFDYNNFFVVAELAIELYCLIKRLILFI